MVIPLLSLPQCSWFLFWLPSIKKASIPENKQNLLVVALLPFTNSSPCSLQNFSLKQKGQDFTGGPWLRSLVPGPGTKIPLAAGEPSP